jgi:hypothetical protein
MASGVARLGWKRGPWQSGVRKDVESIRVGGCETQPMAELRLGRATIAMSLVLYREFKGGQTSLNS